MGTVTNMLQFTILVFSYLVIQLFYPTPPCLFTCPFAHAPTTLAKNHTKDVMQDRNTFEPYVTLAGGRIRAARCQALSKRSRMQCKKAALKQKRVCMFHGGKSTGPVTKEGRKRCKIAKTVRGYETRAARKYRAEKFRELKALFDSM